MWNSMFFLFPYFQNWLIDSANERNFNIILSLAQISRWLDYNLSWVFKLSSEEHHGNSSLWIRDIAKLFYKLYLMSHAYSFSSFNLLYTILYRLFFCCCQLSLWTRMLHCIVLGWHGVERDVGSRFTSWYKKG